MPRPSGCPICGDCDPGAPHHWMPDGNTLTGYACKHCPALAVECMACGGTGEGEEEDEAGVGHDGRCDQCGGAGLVEVVRADVVDGLIAVCWDTLRFVEEGSCEPTPYNLMDRLRTAIEKADRKPYRRNIRESPGSA